LISFFGGDSRWLHGPAAAPAGKAPFSLSNTSA
jgi:hypothetical protein